MRWLEQRESAPCRSSCDRKLRRHAPVRTFHSRRISGDRSFSFEDHRRISDRRPRVVRARRRGSRGAGAIGTDRVSRRPIRRRALLISWHARADARQLENDVVLSCAIADRRAVGGAPSDGLSGNRCRDHCHSSPCAGRLCPCRYASSTILSPTAIGSADEPLRGDRNGGRRHRHCDPRYVRRMSRLALRNKGAY